MIIILNFIAEHYIISIVLILIILNYSVELILGISRSITGKYPPPENRSEIQGDGNSIVQNIEVKDI